MHSSMLPCTLSRNTLRLPVECSSACWGWKKEGESTKIKIYSTMLLLYLRIGVNILLKREISVVTRLGLGRKVVMFPIHKPSVLGKVQNLLSLKLPKWLFNMCNNINQLNQNQQLVYMLNNKFWTIKRELQIKHKLITRIQNNLLYNHQPGTTVSKNSKIHVTIMQ